jgi:hypothetical protein
MTTGWAAGRLAGTQPPAALFLLARVYGGGYETGEGQDRAEYQEGDGHGIGRAGGGGNESADYKNDAGEDQCHRCAQQANPWN